MAPIGLRQVMKEIRAVDYELHAAFRYITTGEMSSEHIAAFMDASIRRDRMMAHVFSYVAELRKLKPYAAVNAHRNSDGQH